MAKKAKVTQQVMHEDGSVEEIWMDDIRYQRRPMTDSWKNLILLRFLLGQQHLSYSKFIDYLVARAIFEWSLRHDSERELVFSDRTSGFPGKMERWVLHNNYELYERR